jgi:hypothetical protein
MNLKENIFRINTLILEDKFEDKVRKLIDKFGFEYVFQTIGYNVIDYITKEEKINFIKSKVEQLSDEFGGSGISPHELYREPIFYGETKDELRQIEYFSKTHVYVDVYDLLTDSHLGDFTVVYEALSNELLQEVFEFFLSE